MVDLPPLTSDLLWAILRDEISDEVANGLVWQGLGYRWDSHSQQWQTGEVAEDWRKDYPEPPNFIESRPATVKLTRSIPQTHKQLLKEELGFKGYTLDELVPRKTRRATLVNWLLSYRKNLGEAVTDDEVTSLPES
ncbi:DUF1823 family protein [Prochlorothrix hollandica]|uniref:DUF1823 domain-containing protein n=1 Tax=Prochlorothrix hollandica PCC 9006 = CALU 1027 TaxID=317619 RepID=A0A0M2PSA9_PROHO|nr:DUF1823 family protein [Prochlorothrix hollandica]KKI98047.1 hypothetical protein PROH_20105 [Prochlorothrix hollandica PCC 9006 = CALU 1027]